VARGGDSGGAVDVDAEVIVPAQNALSGVQPHPHTKVLTVREHMSGERPLCGRRSPHGSERRTENNEEGVSLCSNLDALALCHGGAHQPEVMLLHLPIRSSELFEQPSRTLDVCKEECDSPRRQLGH
jgi:hypothetical protein